MNGFSLFVYVGLILFWVIYVAVQVSKKYHLISIERLASVIRQESGSSPKIAPKPKKKKATSAPKKAKKGKK